MIARPLDAIATGALARSVTAQFHELPEWSLVGPTLTVRLTNGNFRLIRGARSIQFGPFLTFNHSDRLTVIRTNHTMDTAMMIDDLDEGPLRGFLVALSETDSVLHGTIRPQHLTFTFASYADENTLADILRPLLTFTRYSGEVMIGVIRPEPVRRLRIVR